jgi:WD40 repeat protein
MTELLEVSKRPSAMPTSSLQVVLAVGTYEGGIAAYEIELVLLPKDQSDDEDREHNVDLSLKTSNSTTPLNKNQLQMIFASPIHSGSVRSLTVAAATITGANAATTTATASTALNTTTNNLLVSTGYDEMIKLHDFGKHKTSCGEIRTPSNFGTPVCSAFAPPYVHWYNNNNVIGTDHMDDEHHHTVPSSHCLVGFSGSYTGETGNTTTTTNGNATTTTTTAEATGGKLVIYKKRDWSIHHVLNGHEGGVASISVHPTGKLALSGGINDGKIKLWDLERGRLAYSSSIVVAGTKSTTFTSATGSNVGSRKSKVYDSVVCIVWNTDGNLYGFCYGSHITVRHVETGSELLDVELPSKVNQICFLQGVEGMFVAAACNDGSLPVLAVENIDEKNDSSVERRAIMAIEPIDGPVAGVERFKCIQSITGYYVATANSAGVLSVMNLQGAVSMITSSSTATQTENSDNDDDNEDSDSEDEEEKEFAVDIIDSVRIGNGARITCLVAWTSAAQATNKETTTQPKKSLDEMKQRREVEERNNSRDTKNLKRSNSTTNKKDMVELDPEALVKARALVSQAKKIQKRKNEKRTKMS